MTETTTFPPRARLGSGGAFALRFPPEALGTFCNSRRRATTANGRYGRSGIAGIEALNAQDWPLDSWQVSGSADGCVTYSDDQHGRASVTGE
jgi:hypothetical protein